MANRYWVGGSATWDATAGTKWALTSNGAGGQAVPTNADDVFFDGASGTVTVTMGAASNVCKNLNFNGFTGTWTGANGLDVYGSVYFSSTMTFSFGDRLSLKGSSSTNTFTSNGKTGDYRLEIYYSAGGKVTLQDALTINRAGYALYLYGGELDTNNYNITLAGIIQELNLGYSRILTLGSSTIIFTGTGTLWDNGVATNRTINAGTSIWKFTNTSNTAISLPLAGMTLNNIWFDRANSTGSITINGSNTFNDFKDTGTAAHSLLFTTGTTQTVKSFSVKGSSGKLITINSTTTGTHALTFNGSGKVNNAGYLNIQHSVATPADTWYAGINSTNNQSVSTAGSGWLFSEAPAGATAGILLSLC